MTATKKKRVTLSEMLLNVLRSSYDIGRTFPAHLEASDHYRRGFHAGVYLVNEKLRGLIRAVERFERTDTVRMADESEMFDALQWNLAQYRTLKSILSCEGQAYFVEDCIIKALERVLAGEKMDKVTV
jgi:hypothetical protein